MDNKKSELLAPAGSYDAALAAFQYGADAVYLGLTGHSARAEATNFTREELISITAYAHSLSPRRAVYVAINTLLKDDEIPSLLASLDAAREANADAVIIQDLAVYSIARAHFPSLVLHASTQMCVHNLEGARMMKELGFSRVVFARELSLAEIKSIAEAVDIETEVFIHGALCYAYSGICLFSAISAGRSGNRGRCAYCCRERFSNPSGKDSAFPFSMRDLRLGTSVRDLVAANVTSLKIEGRMKSPLYVAAATRLYRLILDGAATTAEIEAAADDLRTVFSRPVTRLYFDSLKGDPSGIIDSETVGHRGTPVGTIEAVRSRASQRLLRFTTSRPLELHDGLQIDLPGRPFGFPVTSLYFAGETQSKITCPAHKRIDVLLPRDAPNLPIGAKIFCSSSQAVHRALSFSRPRTTALRATSPVDITVTLSPTSLSASAIPSSGSAPTSVTLPAGLSTAKNPEGTRSAVQKAFSRMGESNWQAQSISLEDPDSLYAPASLLNELRRQLCAALDAERAATSAKCFDAIVQSVSSSLSTPIPADPLLPTGTSYKLRICDEVRHLDAAEVVLAVSNENCRSLPTLLSRLALWQAHNTRLRIALPTISRNHESAALHAAITTLYNTAAIRAWEVPDLASLHLLRRLCPTLRQDNATITAAPTLYAFNHISAAQLRTLGISAAVAPSESSDDQLAAFAASTPGFYIFPVTERPPLFISETRPSLPRTTATTYTLTDRRGNAFTVEQYDGRWLTRRFSPLNHTPPPTAIYLRHDLS